MSRPDWVDVRGLRLSADDFDAAAAAVGPFFDARAIADDVLRAAGRQLVATYLRQAAARPVLDMAPDVRGWLLAEANTLDQPEAAGS